MALDELPLCVYEQATLGYPNRKELPGDVCQGLCLFAINFQLVKSPCGGELIAAVAPSFLYKSGKKTYGVSKFWSGAAGKALKGLEAGRLCFVDVRAGTLRKTRRLLEGGCKNAAHDGATYQPNF